MSLVSRLLAKSRLVASDSFTLASALLAARPTSIPSVRDVLIRSARHRQDNGNLVAVSVLKLDREVGLVRYRGLGGYVSAKGGLRGLLLPGGSGAAAAAFTSGSTGGFNMTRFLFGPPSGRGRGDIDTPGGSSTGNDIVTNGRQDSSEGQKKARVAFMITSAQRQQLTSELGYSTTDIRSLRPLEALLILEHSIGPGNDDEVKRLVAENEELERKEARRAEMEMAAAAEEAVAATASIEAEEVSQQRQGDLKESTIEETPADAHLALAAGNDNASAIPTQTQEAEQEPTSLSGSISYQSAAVQQALERPLEQELNNEGGSAEESVQQDAILSGSVGDGNEDKVWYEVIETSMSQAEMDDATGTPEGESTVVAMYETLEEAQDCLEWKEQRGKDRYSYEIKQR